MADYQFRAYCDICNEASEWWNGVGGAYGWRSTHFDMVHPDNPMEKENCRIQRWKA